MIVRALAVQQPWAGLIANGTKKIECRTWSTPYRGPILIVASRGRHREGTERWRLKGKLTETDNVKGATICVVDVVDVVFDPKDELFEWKLARPRLVPVTPINGKLNLYNETVPDSWRVHFSERARTAAAGRTPGVRKPTTAPSTTPVARKRAKATSSTAKARRAAKSAKRAKR